VRRIVTDVVVGEEPAASPATPSTARAPSASARGRRRRRLGGLLVLADRAHAEAEARGRERGHRDHRDGGEAEGQVIALGQPVAGDGGRGQGRDLRQLRWPTVVRKISRGPACRSRSRRTQPERRHADHEREHGGRRRARGHREQHRRAGVHSVRVTSAPRPKKAAWPRFTCRRSRDDVPGLGERDRHKTREHEVQDVLARRGQRQQREERERREITTASGARGPRPSSVTGGPDMAPHAPNARSAPGNPWRSSVRRALIGRRARAGARRARRRR